MKLGFSQWASFLMNFARIFQTYILSFDRLNDELTYSVKNQSGFLSPLLQKHVVSFDEAGLLPVKQKLFKDDALIFENSQARKVTIYDHDKRKYLSVEFETFDF